MGLSPHASQTQKSHPDCWFTVHKEFFDVRSEPHSSPAPSRTFKVTFSPPVRFLDCKRFFQVWCDVRGVFRGFLRRGNKIPAHD